MSHVQLEVLCHASRKSVCSDCLAAYEGGAFAASYERDEAGAPRLKLTFQRCPALRAGPLREWLESQDNGLHAHTHAAEMRAIDAGRRAGLALREYVDAIEELGELGMPHLAARDFAQAQLNRIFEALKETIP